MVFAVVKAFGQIRIRNSGYVYLEFICVRDTRIRHMLNKYKEITENGIPLENVTIHCSADISVRENGSIPNISVYTNGFAT